MKNKSLSKNLVISHATVIKNEDGTSLSVATNTFLLLSSKADTYSLILEDMPYYK